MTPQAALAAQIEKYRAMTGEERLKLALDLHEFSCRIFLPNRFRILSMNLKTIGR